ncbi:exopolysaccharide biosynthesis polyprenyl glycosylphosphotransferase [Cylindrospermopsis raciborskii S07]|uniref:Sugar transferase n=2 Tax=Cylindrospermopsis raciborskii TaxID=77022 RepID=A0A838WJY1_9CYAN|nr:sugar transferase [Cylindrospermopsis raciborskii]MBA4444733.1 sugar transferase [Cylindrospermopsis raciborskii CS-506_C]MBA4448952.1 sugar transferase [Cylindrospermopsis raciborskii CS-506_D]MBA4455581.1 sugar transferase [Cylindrospermopsis raciborskii CS-506_B]MBA4464927.1 sugar transferase [Cylindrospermopsis raciborskii CS-506_A]PNJ92602.1 exopolysaccharide biosynthesis polyprenyl glycosylphosphotransferase [Cylindrospermopsis raciborskii C07]
MLEVKLENPRLKINASRVSKISRLIAPIILTADLFGLVISLALTSYLRLGHVQLILNPTTWAFVFLILTGMYLLDTYHPNKQIAGMRAGARVIVSNSTTALLCSLLIYLANSWQKDLSLDPITFLISLVAFTIWAINIRLLAAQWERSHVQNSYWLMLGAGDRSMKFADIFSQTKHSGQLIVLTENPHIPKLNGMDPPLILDKLDNLPNWADQKWSGVVVGDGIDVSDYLHQILMKLRLQGIPVYRLPDACEELCWKISPSLLEDHWFSFSSGFNLVSGSLRIRVKRVIDIVLATLLLVILFPVMVVVGILIKLESSGPIFYSQIRTGLHGNPFRVYKFRSMYRDAEKRGAQWASERDPRITKVGYWLRILRIDELPQILNVLRGEMSLIGPRPERPEFDVKLKEAIPYYELRYLVKPGITGWAQVLYPYGASLEDSYEKLAYDLYYIKNYSLWLDFAIIFKTVRVVFLGKGR